MFPALVHIFLAHVRGALYNFLKFTIHNVFQPPRPSISPNYTNVVEARGDGMTE